MSYQPIGEQPRNSTGMIVGGIVAVCACVALGTLMGSHTAQQQLYVQPAVQTSTRVQPTMAAMRGPVPAASNGQFYGAESAAQAEYNQAPRMAYQAQSTSSPLVSTIAMVMAPLAAVAAFFAFKQANPVATPVRAVEQTQAFEVPRVMAMAAYTGKYPGNASTKAAISGFGRIGRNVLRCWHGRTEKPFNITVINAGSMSPKQAAHLLKYDSVLGTFDADVQYGDDWLSIDGHQIKLIASRDPTACGWGDMGVEVIIEGTGAFNSLEGSSKHLAAGAKKVVITAPGSNCPTYVCGVNEEDYNPATEHVVSNASCTTNGMASVCKVLDETFGIEYGTMTTTHSYTGDQMILDGRHSDLRRARAGAVNIVPTSTGAAKAVALVLPSLKGKLNGIALRVPTPNVSIVDLVVKTSKEATKESVNAALKAASASGPMAGILGYTDEPLVSSDFKQTNVSNTVDGDLSMVMGGDMVKVVMWYDNEWGYSQRVIDLTAIVCNKLGAAAPSNAVKTNAEGLEYVHLTHPSGAESTVYLYGADVTSYKDADGTEWIAVRPDAKMDGSKPISGGLSHCFPQFGPGAIQQHGFARNVNWTLVDSSPSSATFELTPNDYTKEMWDKPFKCTFKVNLTGTSLDTEYHVENTGGADFDFQAALHSYFDISSIKNTSIGGSFIGKTFLNKMADPPAEQIETRAILTIPEEYDRVYSGVNDPVLIDSGKGKQLNIVNKSGWKDTVLWNPYGNTGMGYDNFVCVESVAFDPVKLSDGQKWVGSMSLVPE